MATLDVDKIKEEAKEDIYRACNAGDIELLYRSLNLHPEILDEIDMKRFVHTPLHEAAKMGHSKFCAEIMNLMPSFGKKLNPDGFSPLHLALQNRNEATALTLVDIDKELVRVKGKDGITPLIYCAGTTDYSAALAKFLRDCPQSIFDVSTRSETALHVALKSGNSDGAVMIVNWIRRSSREKVLHWKDDEGNTPLHLAAKHKCPRAVKILVGTTRLNQRNHKSQTPLDIAFEVRQEETIQLLKRKKAMTSGMMTRKLSEADFLKSDITCGESFIKTYYEWISDLNTDMRNVVLVVAVLIATATYTAMLQPPGGLYQGSATTGTKTTTITAAAVMAPPLHPKSNVGKMVMNDGDYRRFMPTNTLAFTLSIMVIIFVLPSRPYTISLHLSLIFLSYSCLIAMLFVSDDSKISDVSFYLCWSLLAFAFILKSAYFWFMKGFFWEVSPEWLKWHYFAEGLQKSTSRMSNLRKQYRLTLRSLKENAA